MTVQDITPIKRAKKPKKKSKRPNNSPARMRYWASRHLEKNKIKNLMRCCGMTRAEALKYWHEGRKDGQGRRLGRVPAGYLRYIA